MTQQVQTDNTMGTQASNELSQAEIGRRPSDQEMMVLLQLQRKLFTRLVLSPEHLALLERYWDTYFVNKNKAPAFERISPFWCTEGGFTTENPADDLRSMGELGLQCLVYFAEHCPGEARMMKRAKGGYPFVKAALAVARSLSETMHLIGEDGQQGDFPVAETLYWQILESEESFYRLFSLSFLLFEELYCEEIARDRTLPVTERIPTSVVAELVDATKTKLLSELKRAPMTLQDLQSLCTNANHVLDQVVDQQPSPSKYSASKGLTRSVSTPETTISTSADRLAQWKQHQTTRKSMREAAKSWGSKEEMHSTGGGVAPRLVPRPPEIALATKTLSEPLDLFQGLITKQVVDGTTSDDHAIAPAS